MIYSLIFLGFVLMLADWFAVFLDLKKLEYVAKPGVMMVLIAAVLLLGAPFSLWQAGEQMLSYFLMGLLFSLIGDMLLMLPKQKFLAGLVMFLLGHLSYILSFSVWRKGFDLYLGMIFGSVLLFVYFFVVKSLWAALEIKGKGNLKIPVAVYALVLASMAFSAMISFGVDAWALREALFLSLGAVLFCTSDLLLAFRRFVWERLPNRIWVHATYHLGQLFLTLGILLHVLA